MEEELNQPVVGTTQPVWLTTAKTKKDTVNLALREIAARHRRAAALEHYAELASEWDFEAWERLRAAEKTRRRDPLSGSTRP